uniref:Uncharacterized protein n=1 Tax=viral metagenome TaxID=1070528 RepID=A0A6M3ILR0_9ZZZZ
MESKKVLEMLERLTEKIDRANSLQHSRKNHTIPAEDWSELYQLTAEAKAIIHENKTLIYKTDAMYRYEKTENGNPLELRFEVHKAGENGLYNEIAIDCFDSKGELVGSVTVGLCQNKKDMRVLSTAYGEGGGDHVIAIYPMRDMPEAVDSNFN